jgi:hypothetical protein
MQPTINDMIYSEQQEARCVRAFLEGNLDTSVLWLAPGVPSHANAVLMAAELDIQRERLTIKSRRNNQTGRLMYFAVMVCRRGTRSHAGASCSQDRAVAIEFAFRNAVRQLISQTGVKLVWQDKRKEARRYA